jgi:ribosomal protein L37AE/L43A
MLAVTLIAISVMSYYFNNKYMLGKHKQTLKEKIQRKNKLRDDIDNTVIKKDLIEKDVKKDICPKCKKTEHIYNQLGSYTKCKNCNAIFDYMTGELITEYDKEQVDKFWFTDVVCVKEEKKND